MNTRISTIRTAAEIWSQATWGTDKTKAADPVTRTIWMVSGIAGAAVFFGSFGFFAMPLIAGWSWLGAGAAFVAGQYISQILLDLHHYWKKASAFLWMAKNAMQGKLKEELNANREYWEEVQTQA